MEKVKVKHDHLFTKLLKATIFSLLMLAPLMAVGAKCAYTIFNKNAKDSYYGETINQSELINYSSIKTGDVVYFITGSNSTITQDIGTGNYINVSNFNINDTAYTSSGSPSYTIEEVNRVRVLTNGSNVLYFELKKDSLSGYYFVNTINSTNFSFIYLSYQSTYSINLLMPYFYYYEYNDYSYLDNAFYYAVDQLAEQPIFNWTTETAIYNAVNQMTTGFELGTSANIMALLITYWAILTAIYVIIDIVIELFVKLTHMFN